MLLVNALFRSLHGIARRQVSSHGKTEVYFAVVSDKGHTHVINCRNGAVRETSAEDQARGDWTPFQEQPEIRRRVRFKKETGRQRAWGPKKRRTPEELEAAKMEAMASVPEIPETPTS